MSLPVAASASPSSASSPLLPASLAAVSTLAELLDWRVAQSPQAEAYRQYEAAGRRWQSFSWQDTGARVQRYARALAGLGLERGARVALLLPNGYETVCLDQALLSRACVPVPMHALDNAASIAYILADSDAALLVAQSAAQWQAVAQSLAQAGSALPALRRVVLLEPPVGGGTVGAPAVPVQSLASWLDEAGPDSADLPDQPPQRPRPEDLAALVYTSGTTGKPKGVMLSHANVLENVKATLQRVAPGPDDLFLSFLPLSHTFERTAGYYLPIAAGCCVAFARSVAELAEDMKTQRPTILISVPRIYERVYSALQGRLSGAPLKARLFKWAQDLGWRRFCRAQGLDTGEGGRGAPAWLDALAWPLLERLAARPLQAQFGGRLRLAVSGGAPLSAALARCFLGLGLPILQGYGMTETSPVVAANGVADNDPATVGRALPGVELRIGERQELLVRGPSVMQGYWKREADTAAAFVDGWLRTGDQAAIDASGRVRILGRVKEIIVTSTGEKIAPADLELAITADGLFEQAYAFGDNRPFIACVVVLSRRGWDGLAAGLGLDPESPDSLQAPAARAAVLERVRALTASFPHYAQPRAVALSLSPWTVENNLMTPTLKLKRKNLQAYFSAVIEQLYRR